MALFLGALLFCSATIAPALAKPQFAAIAVDARNGKVLFSVDPDGSRHPASITKVMTLYLLFEDLKAGKLKLDTELKVSARAAAMAPSKLGLKPGSTIAVDDAIRALVTRSANDVAAAIGENLGGTEAAFATRMTETARALGMSRTTFKNASGLPNPAQVTTARDIATLSLRIQRDFPQYYPYFRIISFAYKGQTIRTHNRLLGKFDGADGIKTGYIGASGFNLTSSARRGDRRIVGVVLGARSGPARDVYMMSMLNKAFPKCAEGKTIAALAGSSKGAVDPLAGTSLAKLATATQTKKAEEPSASNATDDASLAALAETSATDEDAADPEGGAPATSGSAFKKVKAASSPAEPKVVAAEIGGQSVPTKLPFAVKQPVKQGEVDKLVTQPGEQTWNVQIGAFVTKKDAQNKLISLKKTQPQLLKNKLAFMVTVQKGSQTSYRARFSGFTEEDAKALCGKLSKQKLDCEPLPPQS